MSRPIPRLGISRPLCASFAFFSFLFSHDISSLADILRASAPGAENHPRTKRSAPNHRALLRAKIGLLIHCLLFVIYYAVVVILTTEKRKIVLDCDRLTSL